jgi:hypothetical protein
MNGDPIFFGLTIAEFEDYSLKILLTALILYMLFIIGNLAKKSKAGRYGTMWLFAALGLCHSWHGAWASSSSTWARRSS